MEVWKDIKDYENLYQVSNLGNVKTLKREKWNGAGWQKLEEKIMVKKGNKRNGYQYVILSKNNIQKTFPIHRLVAQAFIPNENNLPCINHRDENKHNNCVDNLEWCTKAYNNSYGTKKPKLVNQYDLEGNFINQFNSSKEASEYIGKSLSNIRMCCLGRQLTCGGYKWGYAQEVIL